MGHAMSHSTIVPDRESWQDSITLPGEQDLPAIGLDLNGANREVSEQVICKDSSTCTSEEVQSSRSLSSSVHILTPSVLVLCFTFAAFHNSTLLCQM
jgi:hypothetical protein